MFVFDLCSDLNHALSSLQMLHYYAKEFYAPTAISGYVQNNTVHVYLVQDHIDVEELNIRVSVHRWNTFSPAWSKNITVKPSATKHSVSFTSRFMSEGNSQKTRRGNPTSSYVILLRCRLKFFNKSWMITHLHLLYSSCLMGTQKN